MSSFFFNQLIIQLILGWDRWKKQHFCPAVLSTVMWVGHVNHIINALWLMHVYVALYVQRFTFFIL